MRLTPEQIALIHTLYAQGVSKYAIAREIGCSQPAVTHHVSPAYRRRCAETAKARYAKRKGQAPKPQPAWLQQAIALRQQGKSFYAISQLLSVNPATVRRHLDPGFRERENAFKQKHRAKVGSEAIALRERANREKREAAKRREDAAAIVLSTPLGFALVGNLFLELTELSPDRQFEIRFDPTVFKRLGKMR